MRPIRHRLFVIALGYAACDGAPADDPAASAIAALDTRPEPDRDLELPDLPRDTGGGNTIPLPEHDDGWSAACPLTISQPFSTRVLDSTDWDFGYAVATDTDVCAIYVGGATTGLLDPSFVRQADFGNDAFVARYSTTGARLWVRQLGTDELEEIRGVATDSSHNVYVTGWTGGTLAGSPDANQGGADAFLAKYDQDGNHLWTRELGSDEDDAAYAIALNDRGEIYIAGSAEGALPGGGGHLGGDDFFLAKYDQNGNRLAVGQHGNDAGQWAFGLAIGPAGNPYVTGFTYGELASGMLGVRGDLFVGKYDGSCRQIWISQRGSSEYEAGAAVAVNDSGQVFVTGTTLGGLDGHTNQGGYDMFVLRYDANGTWVWTDQRGTSENDVGTGIAVTEEGGPYAAGWTFGGLDGTTDGLGADVYVVRYGRGGVRRWTRDMNATSAHYYANALALDAWGNAYIAGESDRTDPQTGAVLDAFAVKFDDDGYLR
jgi:hypothetical protein